MSKSSLDSFGKEILDYISSPSHWNVIINVFLIVLFALVARYIQGCISKKLMGKGKKTKKDMWRVALIYATDKPISYLILLLGVLYSISLLKSEIDTGTIFIWEEMARKVSIVGLFSWSIVRFINKMEKMWVDPSFGGKAQNKTTATAVGRILKIAVVITTVLVILQSLSIPINGVLALGSAGTIILGIASKDLLANFFGGLIIFLDSPFKVGDWILSPDKSIQGTVEHIGWRLTRIRTFSQRPLYVPNGVFLTIAIENPSRMLNRQIKMNFGLRYQDATKVGEITEKVEKMIKSHPEIDTNRTTFVAFNNFGPSSLDCLVYCFTKTTVWVPYLKVQQDIFIKISEIVEECGASMAFPTTTLDFPADEDVPQWLNSKVTS